MLKLLYYNVLTYSEVTFTKLFKIIHNINRKLSDYHRHISGINRRLDDLQIRHQATTDVLCRLVRNKRVKHLSKDQHASVNGKGHVPDIVGDAASRDLRVRKPRLSVTLYESRSGTEGYHRVEF